MELTASFKSASQMTVPRPWTLEQIDYARDYLAIDGDCPSGLRWIKAPYKATACVAGKPAGARTSRGYWCLKLQQTYWRTPRLILLISGDIPKDFTLRVDHVDRNKDNNRIENLRWVTPLQSTLNRRLPNRTGFPFAHQTNESRNFHYHICIPGGGHETRYGFKDAESAHLAALERRAQLGFPWLS